MDVTAALAAPEPSAAAAAGGEAAAARARAASILADRPAAASARLQRLRGHAGRRRCCGVQHCAGARRPDRCCWAACQVLQA